MGRSGRITLVSGVMDCNGVVSGADAHHQHHVDERGPDEVYNNSGETITVPLTGIIGKQLSYRSTAASDDAPRAAAYSDLSDIGRSRE